MNRVTIDGADFTWSHVESITLIGESEWDACTGGNPLVRHAFFRALEASGSLGPERGVVPGYFTLRDSAGRLSACVPTVLKWGNLREFGPEITWLERGLAEGCFSWPKFQACSPFYPQIAPKLLIHPRRRSVSFRSGLLALVLELAASQFSTFSLMHISADDARAAADRGALISHEPGSLWTNPGVGTFEEYVAQLPHRKRRHLIRERARIEALGLTIAVQHGSEVSPALLDDFCAGHREVCRRHGGGTWLPAEIYEQLCSRMPDAVRVFTAYDGDRYVGGLFALQSREALFLQTWSNPDDVRGLCFDLVCYRPIEYALGQGLTAVDGGLSIPYKAERGYPTQPVFNAHWFFDDRLEALAREVLSWNSETQRLLDVGQQIDRILDTDRQSHQVVGNLQL